MRITQLSRNSILRRWGWTWNRSKMLKAFIDKHVQVLRRKRERRGQGTLVRLSWFLEVEGVREQMTIAASGSETRLAAEPKDRACGLIIGVWQNLRYREYTAAL